MKIGQYFKSKRELMGFSKKELAEQIQPGFQESLLQDFELGDDNDLDSWNISDFKAYCAALEIQPCTFAEIPVSNLSHLPLSELIKARREEKGYTIGELAELVGYYPVVIESIENDSANSEVCIDALRNIGLHLDIPFRLLLEKI
jgi:ribosome-binding protein aMBF1 (putative translation factor)